MKKNKKYIIQISLITILIFGLSLGSLLLPDREYSTRERRYLAQRPEISGETISTGEFMEAFETYSYDQMALREPFMALKSFLVRKVFLQKDDGGYYKVGNHILKMEYPANYERLEKNMAQNVMVYDSFIKGKARAVYFSLIYDKNYYMGKEAGYPLMDYEDFSKRAKSLLPDAEYIDISELLTGDDFYCTDLHWKQENIGDVAGRIMESMGAKALINPEIRETGRDFYGAYYSQSGMPAKADKINYIYGDYFDNLRVYDFDTGKETAGSLYDEGKLLNKDPYEFFLSGNKAIQVIENPGLSEEKELVVFRDSFGSSIAHYFTGGYSKITLVDLRYINPTFIESFVDFQGKDVLFLYSSATLNSI